MADIDADEIIAAMLTNGLLARRGASSNMASDAVDDFFSDAVDDFFLVRETLRQKRAALADPIQRRLEKAFHEDPSIVYDMRDALQFCVDVLQRVQNNLDALNPERDGQRALDRFGTVLNPGVTPPP